MSLSSAGGLPLTVGYVVRDIRTGVDLTASTTVAVARGAGWLALTPEVVASLRSGSAYRILFERPGYVSQVYNLLVRPYETRLSLDVALAPAAGTLSVSSDTAGIEILLNDSSSYLAGGADRGTRRLEPLAAGTRDLAARPGRVPPDGAAGVPHADDPDRGILGADHARERDVRPQKERPGPERAAVAAQAGPGRRAPGRSPVQSHRKGDDVDNDTQNHPALPRPPGGHGRLAPGGAHRERCRRDSAPTSRSSRSWAPRSASSWAPPSGAPKASMPATAGAWRLGAALGAAIGAVGGIVGSLAGQAFLLGVGERLMASFSSQRSFARVVLPVSRAVAWAVLGLFVGAAEGVRAGSPRKVAVGVLGGILGGLVGGVLLEYSRLLLPLGATSRLIGLVVLGVAVAFFYGLIERGFAAGVLRVLNGRLKGKEFLVNQRRARIGASPRSEIALAGYEDLAERHAEVRLRGGEVVITSLEPKAPVLVNDRPVEERVLKYEDVVKVGQAKLFFRYE